MSQSGPPAEAKQAQAAALQELDAAQKKKRAIDTSLANLEASIYAFEGSYLEETMATGGNIIKGFDNYLKPPTATVSKKKQDITEGDRLFSTSSVSYMQSLEARKQFEYETLTLAGRR
ncbi:histone acetyltransferase subunit NuA4-domain-containing protein [Kockovaella imperatae]|uniref:Chromatin modification-related protein EAF6 n=1 Tax=Kockovaella imperatae TaxID=4999 RepID=A0A1Y1UI64_9TREE|nr:histone acetyltransferase subunit NuA4-domain-containing protein [Kockovaella imperatae]ORX37174.1 histone acetyltransferase subunit NuA4-domain-containing protein [Kockovaella imperatae]